MTELAAIPRPVPAGVAPPPAGTGALRKVLVCLTPPPSARLASGLVHAGPPDSVRIASTARQVAVAVATSWPDVLVTDVLTAHSMNSLLTRLGGHRADVVTVTTADTAVLRAVIAGLAAPPQPPPRVPGPVPRLTGRQTQVLDLVCDGLTNQQIADRLHIGYDMVKTHLAQMRGQLGAISRAHLAVLAVGRGLVAAR